MLDEKRADAPSDAAKLAQALWQHEVGDLPRDPVEQGDFEWMVQTIEAYAARVEARARLEEREGRPKIVCLCGSTRFYGRSRWLFHNEEGA